MLIQGSVRPPSLTRNRNRIKTKLLNCYLSHSPGATYRRSLPSERSHDRDQTTNLIVCVIDRERRTHCGFNSKTPERGLSAMVARANRDACSIERFANVFSQVSIQDKRDHADLLSGRANHSQSRNLGKSLGRVMEQGMFVCSNVGCPRFELCPEKIRLQNARI